MCAYTRKKLFSKGYTTYNDDGTVSHTIPNLFTSGYTTLHADGSRSHTYKSPFSDTYVTHTTRKPAPKHKK